MIKALISVILALSGLLLTGESLALPGYAGEVARLCTNQPLPLPKPVFPVSDCLGCHADSEGGSFTLNEDGQKLLDYHQNKSPDNLAKVMDAFCMGAYYNTQGNGGLPPIWNTPQNPAPVGYLGSLEAYWLARLGTENQTLTLSKSKAAEQSSKLPGAFNLVTSPDNCWGQNMNFGLVYLTKPGNLTVTVEADQSQGSMMIPGFALYQGWDSGTEAARHNPIFFGESNPLGTQGLTYVGDALGETPGGKISKTFYGLEAGKYEVFVTVGDNDSSEGAYRVTFQTAPPGTTVFIDPVPVKGTITSDLGGLNCGTGGTLCQADFKNGDQVTLTATPDSGNSFSGWKGVCSGFETTCTLTINGSKTVSALFKAPSRILTVSMFPAKGIITSEPKGVQCGGPNGYNCNPPFELGTNVTLKAVPNQGYRVQQWTGDAECGDLETCSVLMDAHKNVTVNFVRIWTLTVSAPEGLRITSTPAGIDCIAATCTRTFDNKTAVTLKATSTNGKRVKAWTGACAAFSPDQDCTLTLSSNLEAGATQAEGTQVLTVTKDGAGRIVSSPEGIDCGDFCSHEFPTDTPVNLTATPDPGQRLAGWQGCDTVNEGTCVVALTSGRTASARFEAQSWDLDVVVNGVGGRITSNDGHIDCPALCATQILDGQNVQLTATAATGYQFIGWGGGCSQAGDNPVCSLIMSKKQHIVALFEPMVHTVSLANKQEGRVVSDPAGLDCPGQCLFDFNQGTLLKLTATPKPGYRLAGWTGPCAGAGEICQFVVNASATVEARFELIVHTLTVSPSGLGGIISEPRGIKCGVFASVRGDDCSEIYLDGDQVTLKPQPEAGQVFTAWGGACQGSGDCTLTLKGDRAVTAIFTRNGAVQADGVCGSATESSLGGALPESVQLCSAGQAAAPVQLDDGRFTWICQGSGENTQSARCYTQAINGKKNQPSLQLVSRKIKSQDCTGLKLLSPGCGLVGKASEKIDARFVIQGGAGKGKYRVRKSGTPGARCKTRLSGRILSVMTRGEPGACTFTVKKLQDRKYNEVESLPVTVPVKR